MLNTVIDYKILNHFIHNQPKQTTIENLDTLYENEYWNAFLKFIKEQSNIVITNITDLQFFFFKSLTTGRKDTTIRIEEKFIKPHKYKFPKNTHPHSVFFLKEDSEVAQKKYRKQNGFLFGFMDDYPNVWKFLALLQKREVIPVRMNENKRLKEWPEISEYITPFTDMIIADNYMFDKDLMEHNLIKIIKIYSQKTPIRFNLLLLSYADEKKTTNNHYKEIKDFIITRIKELNINCNLSIVYATRSIKEHDRGIFTNYLRIKSGDSFNYFKKNGDYATKGTDIDFHTLAKPDKFTASQAALYNISEIIKNIEKHREKDLRLQGDLKNRLLLNRR